MKEKAIKIVKRLQDKGFEAVFAGGCVRDMLMDIEPKDFDIATSASPRQIKILFPKTIAVGENFGVIIVVDEGEHFEVATFRADHGSDGRRPIEVSFTSMRNDALRRDLTINGIFFDPIKEELFDFVNGEKDIKDRLIRFIGHPAERIKEDNLRILRAVRFFAKSKEWNIERKTFLSLEIFSDWLLNVSAERIREELEKMLLLPEPSVAFKMMLNLGILDVILPELAKLDTISQNPKWHGEGNAFVHTMLAIDTAREFSDDPIIMWGTLLHDIGKGEPDIGDDGKLIFHDHDVKGTEITNRILRELKFSNEDRETITSIVADHMRVKHLPNMRKSKIRRLMSEPHFDKVLLVSDIDSRSSIHEDHIDDKNKRIFVEFAENFKDELGVEPVMPELFITGHDLIKMGVSPGVRLGVIKDAIANMQLDGDLTSREEALEVVKEYFLRFD
jgi:putative nucleotidyltransferase with HDIG domain